MAGGQGRLLHNGWRITPAGRQQKVGDMLLGCRVSPDGRTLAMTNAGFAAPALTLLDLRSGRIIQSLPLRRAWNGLEWGADSNTIYVAGGASPRVHVFKRQGNAFEESDPLELTGLSTSTRLDRDKGQAYVAGLALSRDQSTLYVANIATDGIYALSLPGGGLLKKVTLPGQPRPYCLRLQPQGPGRGLYVTLWADSAVLVLDPSTLQVVRRIETGGHPNDLLFGPGGRLFVSCGNQDVVDVIDTLTGLRSERILTSLTRLSPPGATPNGLALAPDGKTLYVANADNNAVAVVDITTPRQSTVRGFIPTGWYPTVVSTAGSNIYVGSGKGTGTSANPVAALPINPAVPRGFQYIGNMLSGLISQIPVPDSEQLALYTRQVFANTPYSDTVLDHPAQAPPRGSNPIPSRPGDQSPIKYVLYIIKENRTYDQVLGDFKDRAGKAAGNGDPNLTLFGADVTPNHHALARQWVLLDNVYCNGEVSADGHPWSTAALVTDIGQRTWPTQYAGRGQAPLTEKVATPPSGYIWDECLSHGLSYRSYGEQVFVAGADAQPSPLSSVDGVTGLRGHASARWWAAHRQRDYGRADVFIDELHEFERRNNLPRFMVMSLGEDHTNATRPGAFTPRACVASNDLGLGKIVDACSHSKYWKQMAIFVIEDDAQNGPDHVDAHRTAAFVISPFVKRHLVDSTFYTTASFLRTMELCLGLPPMSQYDAAATPLYASFTNDADVRPYHARPASIDVESKNGPLTFGANRSLKFDLTDYDRLTVADEDAFNRILWHSIKGTRLPYPGVVRRGMFDRAGRTPSTSLAGDVD